MAAVAPLGRATQVEPLDGTLAGSPPWELFERHSARILKYCRWQLRNREDAEDATQTTFLYAFRALGRGVVPVNEAAWLQTIAKNVCLTGRQAVRRRDEFEVARDPQALADTLPGLERGRDELFGLGEALESLSDQQRRAILLREWQGLSYREIADEMGLSLSAVEALIFRSRRVLASRLEGEAAPKRRRSLAGFVDLGSLIGAVKSLFGGASAVKVTAGVIAVAGATAIAGTALPVRAEPPVSKAPATAVTASTANGSDAVLRSGPQGRAQHGLEAGRNAGKPGGAGSARSGATRPAGKPAAPTGPGSAPAGGGVPEAPTLPADPPAAPVIPGSLPDPADVALLLPQAPQLPQVPAQALPPISLPAPLSALPTLSSVPDSGVTLP